MKRHWLIAHVVIVLVLLAGLAPSVAAQPAQFANVPFQQLWQRYDNPVAGRVTTRSWTWGPNTFFIGPEPYAESPGGQRVVQYFDKARMELNDPARPAVSSGLLVRELVSGRMAVGNVAFEQRVPSSEIVTGDPAGVNPVGASYADFGGVASIDANRRAPDRTGQTVNQGMRRGGSPYIIPQETLDGLGLTNLRYAFYEPTLGHNVPNVFLDYMNQRGVIWTEQGFVDNQPVFEPWIAVMGLPITEPYWTRTLVGGTYRVVLVQLFERRVLTYFGLNPPESQVEMGNVGQHYFTWRTTPPPPPPPPPPPVTPDAPTFTSGPQRTDLTATTATIEWSTSTPTSTRVEFDTDSSRDPYRNRAGDGNFRTDHRVVLTGLAPNTVYHWRITGQDRSGQSVPENNHSFRTNPESGFGTTITSPRSGQRVTSPLTVTGQEDGTAFEASIVVRLRDTRTGFIYAQQATQVQAPAGTPGPFSVTLFFTPPSSDSQGVVEVVSISPIETEPEQLRASVNVVVVGSGTPPPPSGSNTITRPSHNQRVGSPLRVIGTVDNTVAGGNILVQVLDRNNGAVVNEVFATANNRGEFNVLIEYRSPSPNHPGLVQVVAVRTTDGRDFVPKVSVQIVMA